MSSQTTKPLAKDIEDHEVEAFVDAQADHKSDTDYYRLLAPQAFVGLIDSIAFMVVAPSAVFYVLSLGGSKEQYGFVLASFSFASFLFKPCLGYWCDRIGYQFRVPYLVSITAAALGGLLYFIASAFRGNVAVAIVFLGRFLGGMGAANSTLVFTYIARVIPGNQMTKFSTLLSMVRVIGIAIAPVLNLFLSKIHGKIGAFELTPLNSVGLFLLFSNMISFYLILFIYKEPPTETRPTTHGDDTGLRGGKFWKSVLALDIVLPVLGILGLNANFQVIETGLAPAASDVLGWGPVGISSLFGMNAILMFAVIAFTFQLAAHGVGDDVLVLVGLVDSIIGYGLIYFMWRTGAHTWQFVLPVVFSVAAFPFLGAPTRSFFTKAVAANPALRQHQGTMQAILSMSASVAGFSAPGLIAAFVLRTPEEVAASPDGRELTIWALFAPTFSALLLIGFAYLSFGTVEDIPPEGTIDERAELLSMPASDMMLFVAKLHPHTEANRRHTITLMGIPQVTPEKATVSSQPSRKTII